MLLHETLEENETSNVFQVFQPGDVYIEIIGTYGGETVKMQKSFDRSTYTDFYADGTLAQWTTTVEARRFNLPFGWYRFVASNTGGTTTDVDVYVSGRNVSI